MKSIFVSFMWNYLVCHQYSKESKPCWLLSYVSDAEVKQKKKEGRLVNGFFITRNLILKNAIFRNSFPIHVFLRAFSR